MTQCAEFAGRSWETCTRGIESCLCGFEDNADRIANVLEHHNKWRRGEDEEATMIDPRVIGIAIEEALKLLRAKP